MENHGPANDNDIFGGKSPFKAFAWKPLTGNLWPGRKTSRSNRKGLAMPCKPALRVTLDMAAQLIGGDRSQREVAKALGVAVSTLREGMKGQAEGRKRCASVRAGKQV
jgi:hypothetical protein